MNNLIRYIWGAMVGMIGEYLYRVEWNTAAFVCFILVIIMILTDLLWKTKD